MLLLAFYFTADLWRCAAHTSCNLFLQTFLQAQLFDPEKGYYTHVERSACATVAPEVRRRLQSRPFNTVTVTAAATSTTMQATYPSTAASSSILELHALLICPSFAVHP